MTRVSSWDVRAFGKHGGELPPCLRTGQRHDDNNGGSGEERLGLGPAQGRSV